MNAQNADISAYSNCFWAKALTRAGMKNGTLN